MNIAEIVVSAIGASSVGLLAWFFFGSRKADSASLKGGVQQVAITVMGGYVPADRICCGRPQAADASSCGSLGGGGRAGSVGRSGLSASRSWRSAYTSAALAREEADAPPDPADQLCTKQSSDHYTANLWRFRRTCFADLVP